MANRKDDPTFLSPPNAPLGGLPQSQLHKSQLSHLGEASQSSYLPAQRCDDARESQSQNHRYSIPGVIQPLCTQGMPQWIGQSGQLPLPPLDNDVGLFATEYEALFTNEISGASKNQLLRVMSEKVIPYRARDGWRLFPPVSFYELLLQNEWDRDEILPIAVRCAKWFLSQTVQQADVRIAEVEDLLKRHTAPIQPPAEAPEPLRKTKSSRKRKMTAHQGQNPMIAAELDKSPTMAYRKIIGSKDQFARLKEEYVRHIRDEEANDMEQIDPTWPSTEVTDCQYVRQAVEAIYDTSNFIEKTAALEKKARIDDESTEAPNKKRKVGMETASGMKQTKLNPTDTILADPNSSPQAQLKAVIRHELKDIDVEMVC